MVSSTESSDWNVSPTSRPAPNFPHEEPTSIVLPETLMTDGRPTTANRSSSSSTPRLGSFSIPRTPSARRGGLSQNATDYPQSGGTPTPRPTPADASIVPSTSATHVLGDHGDIGSFNDTPPSAHVTPSSKSARGGAKAVRRGRGGGTSRSRIKPEPNVDETNLADVPPARSVNRGGRPRGSRAGANSNRTINRGGRPRGSRAGASASSSRRPVKRKRRANKSDDDDDDDNGGDTSGSEAINLPMLSSSGRRITQANTFTPPVINLDGPSSSTVKKSRTAARIVDAAPVFLTGAMKRKQARNPAEAAVCRNCGRGHSPNSNQIVFCDGCETPWHQFCHDRPITPTVIQIEESEWHCADCEIEGSLKEVGKGRVTAEDLAQSSGIHRTLKWKQDYLLQLPKDTLVSLLLKAHEAHEEMPLFEQDPKVGFVASAAVVMYEEKGQDQGQSQTTEKEIEVGERQGPNLEREKGEVGYEAPDEDEGYYEEPLPYPKMGNGLVLPPEEDDLGILVDEDETLYSHSWQDGPSWRGPGMNPNVAVDGVCGYCQTRTRIGFTTRACQRCEDVNMNEGRQMYILEPVAAR